MATSCVRSRNTDEGGSEPESPIRRYDPKTAAILATTSGLRRPETLTFHSRRVTCALCVRFEDPM